MKRRLKLEIGREWGANCRMTAKWQRACSQNSQMSSQMPTGKSAGHVGGVGVFDLAGQSIGMHSHNGGNGRWNTRVYVDIMDSKGRAPPQRRDGGGNGRGEKAGKPLAFNGSRRPEIRTMASL